MKILVADDDAKLANLLAEALQEEGFDPEVAHSAQAAEKKIQGGNFALAIIDWIFCGEKFDGCQLVRNLRDKNKDLPIIMLTGRTALADRIQGFRDGADDYLVKPFYLPELLIRIRALLRRKNINNPLFKTDNKDLRLDQKSHKVWVNNKITVLSKKEFQILAALLENPGQTVTREELAQNIWGQKLDSSASNVIDVHVSLIRQKLGKKLGAALRTVRGYGYQLDFKFVEKHAQSVQAS